MATMRCKGEVTKTELFRNADWLLTSASLKFRLRMSQCSSMSHATAFLGFCVPGVLCSGNTFLSYLHNLVNNVMSHGGNTVVVWWQKQAVLYDARPYTPCWVVLWVTGALVYSSFFQPFWNHQLEVLLLLVLLLNLLSSPMYPQIGAAWMIKAIPCLCSERQLFSLLKRIIAETLTWKVSVHMCDGIRREEYIAHHTVIQM